jgi:hypothetical protein
MRSLPFFADLQKNAPLVEAIKDEAAQFSEALAVIEEIDSKNFKYTFRDLLNPEQRHKIFDMQKFVDVHSRFLREVMSALAEEKDWNQSYYACLIFIDAFYCLLLQWWSLIYELAHNGQLQLVDSTGFA